MNTSGYPEWITSLAENPIVILVAATASIVSLFITIAIFRRLRRINLQILLDRRRPIWLKSLQGSASRLAPLLHGAESGQDEMREILVQLRPVLSSLIQHLDKGSETKQKAVELMGEVDSFLGEDNKQLLMKLAECLRLLKRERSPRIVYLKLLELNQTLNEDIEQSKLFRPQV